MAALMETREEMLSRKPKTKKVTLPDGEHEVIVRRWSAADWDRAKAAGADENNTGLQLAMVLCNSQGVRIFDPDNPEDCKACADAYGMDESGVILAAAGKLIVPKEDTIKKSEASPNTDSATN